MREEIGVSPEMSKFDYILVFYGGVGGDVVGVGGEDEPVIVGVVEGVASNLLTQ